MTNKIVVFNTCGSEEEAERIAMQLIQGKLAACVTVIPQVKSFYQWEGRMEKSSECLLLIKTSQDLFPQLTDALEAIHSYEVPEVIALPIIAGSEKYLAWLNPDSAR